MTAFDYGVIAIILLSVGLGAWRGLVGEVLALAAWVVAIVAAWAFGPDVAHALFTGIREPALRLIAGYATVVVAVIVTGAVLRLALRGVLKMIGLSFADRMLGVMFGFTRGLAVVLVLVLIGGVTAAPKAEWWRDASLAPPLETLILAGRPWLPPELSKRIRYR